MYTYMSTFVFVITFACVYLIMVVLTVLHTPPIPPIAPYLEIQALSPPPTILNNANIIPDYDISSVPSASLRHSERNFLPPPANHDQAERIYDLDSDSDMGEDDFIPSPPPPSLRLGAHSPRQLIPFPSLITYNLNSLSQYQTQPGGRARRGKIKDNIQHLGRNHDILCLQETHLNRLDFIKQHRSKIF